jgi:hypothetical protein
MPQIDLYRNVHKAQRARLFGLVVEAGRTDPQDAPAASAIAAMAAALADELHEHGEHEDRFIHPLLAKYVPELAADLAAEHRALDTALAELADAGRRREVIGADSLYRVAARFTAVYLGHLEREEGEAMPALWAQASEGELRGVLMSFRDSRAELQRVASVLGQLPTLTPREAADMVSAAFDGATLGQTRELLTGLLPAPQLRAVLEGRALDG